jgi:hypothetical protein
MALNMYSFFLPLNIVKYQPSFIEITLNRQLSASMLRSVAKSRSLSCYVSSVMGQTSRWWEFAGCGKFS